MDKPVRIENGWFWGTSVHLVMPDGKALVKLVIDKRAKARCEIYDLATHPSAWRKGYARVLMTEAEAVAREKGCEELLLWVERDTWMQKWYGKMGYEVEEFMTPPSEDTVWMSKTL